MSPVEIHDSKAVPPQRREVVAWMQGVSRYGYNPHFVRALTDVSFEVRRGEVFGLLGLHDWRPYSMLTCARELLSMPSARTTKLRTPGS